MELTRWFYDDQESTVFDVNRFRICTPRYPEHGPLLAAGPEAVESIVNFIRAWDACQSAAERLASAAEFVQLVRVIAEQPWELVDDAS